jgi:hypothetical protein
MMIGSRRNPNSVLGKKKNMRQRNWDQRKFLN